MLAVLSVYRQAKLTDKSFNCFLNSFIINSTKALTGLNLLMISLSRMDEIKKKIIIILSNLNKLIK